jgi:hypothetical protein
MQIGSPSYFFSAGRFQLHSLVVESAAATAATFKTVFSQQTPFHLPAAVESITEAVTMVVDNSERD